LSGVKDSGPLSSWRTSAVSSAGHRSSAELSTYEDNVGREEFGEDREGWPVLHEDGEMVPVLVEQLELEVIRHTIGEALIAERYNGRQA
jgi:hypothetical protein